jgi:hypothetical protein
MNLRPAEWGSKFKLRRGIVQPSTVATGHVWTVPAVQEESDS